MARYAQIDVALADEGGYVGRWEKDAAIMIMKKKGFFFLSILLYVYADGRWRNRRYRARRMEGTYVQCDGVVLY